MESKITVQRSEKKTRRKSLPGHPWIYLWSRVLLEKKSKISYFIYNFKKKTTTQKMWYFIVFGYFKA